MSKNKMKRHEEYDPVYVYWLEHNPNYIMESFEGIRQKNSRVVLLILVFALIAGLVASS